MYSNEMVAISQQADGITNFCHGVGKGGRIGASRTGSPTGLRYHTAFLPTCSVQLLTSVFCADFINRVEESSRETPVPEILASAVFHTPPHSIHNFHRYSISRLFYFLGLSSDYHYVPLPKDSFSRDEGCSPQTVYYQLILPQF